MARYKDVERWFTSNGNRIPVLKGETSYQAMYRFLKTVKGKNNNKEVSNKSFKGKMKEEGKTRYFENDDGSRIDYLTNKEYDAICEELNNSLTDEERNILLTYVDTPMMAGSAYLNKMNNENVDKILSPNDVKNGYEFGTLVAWNKNADLLESQKEYDERAQKAYEQYKKENPNDTGYGSERAARKLGFTPRDFSSYGEKERLANLARAKTDSKFAETYNSKNILNIDYNDTTTSNVEFISWKQALTRMDSKDFKYQTKDTKDDLLKMAKQQKQMDDIFNKKGIVLDKDTIVYRRTREEVSEIKNGFTKYGYTSTTAASTISASMPSGARFGSSEIEIIVPKGTKILPLKEVINHRLKSSTDDYHVSINKGVMKQKEILLPRETSFNYISSSGNRHTVAANFKYKSKKKVNGEWVYEY